MYMTKWESEAQTRSIWKTEYIILNLLALISYNISIKATEYIITNMLTFKLFRHSVCGMKSSSTVLQPLLTAKLKMAGWFHTVPCSQQLLTPKIHLNTNLCGVCKFVQMQLKPMTSHFTAKWSTTMLSKLLSPVHLDLILSPLNQDWSSCSKWC